MAFSNSNHIPETDPYYSLIMHPSPGFVPALNLKLSTRSIPKLSRFRTMPTPIVCAKKSSNRKRKKNNNSSSKPPSQSSPATASKSQPLQSPTPSTLPDTIKSSPFFSDSPIPSSSLSQPPDEDPSTTISYIEQLPISDESSLRLPNLRKSTRRRRRKIEKTSTESKTTEKEVLASETVRRLTAAYRAGGSDAQQIIDEIEKDPDYMLQTGNPDGEYDFASALIGTGRPNKQGVYVLPYLQSGHILLFIIGLIASFIYYPGFPLTEADDTIRDGLKKGLALVGIFNTILSTYAYRAAKDRKQPAAFWAIKTVFLGNLAFNELKTNAPVVSEAHK